MVTEANDPAYPIIENGGKQSISFGLTKREAFAMTLDVSECSDWKPEYAATVTGIEKPLEGATQTQWYLFWLKVECAYRVIKADALIEALNQPVKG